jgi:hypothetical protein
MAEAFVQHLPRLRHRRRSSITDSWPAVAAALDRIGVPHPGDFTDKVTFRRCPNCGERNIVRDEDFTCALCDSALPAHWNFVPGSR